MPERNEPVKEVASVSDVARMLRLSRGRFYELMKAGIFPQPSRNPETRRPFFDRRQQEECLRVRRTNCGINGQSILFYCCLDRRGDEIAPRKDHRDDPSRESPQNALARDLRDGLTRLGIVPGSDTTLLAAVRECFPDGYADVDFPTILTTVYRHRMRRDSPDNLTR